MKSILVGIFLVLIAIGCQNDSIEPEYYQDRSVVWTVGHDHSIDTTVILPKSQAPMNFLSVEDYSICGNTNLQIIIKTDDKILVDTVYQDEFVKYPIASDPSENITVRTKLVLGDSLIYCIWEGQARLRFEYGI